MLAALRPSPGVTVFPRGIGTQCLPRVRLPLPAVRSLALLRSPRPETPECVRQGPVPGALLCVSSPAPLCAAPSPLGGTLKLPRGAAASGPCVAVRLGASPLTFQDGEALTHVTLKCQPRVFICISVL